MLLVVGKNVGWFQFLKSQKPSSPSSNSSSQRQHLGQGDKWQMYIPSELGYGDGGTGVLLGMSSSEIPGSQLELQIEFPSQMIALEFGCFGGRSLFRILA